MLPQSIYSALFPYHHKNNNHHQQQRDLLKVHGTALRPSLLLLGVHWRLCWPVFIVRFESCSSLLRDCGDLPSLGMKFKSPREFLWTESWAEHSLHKRNQKRNVETRWLGISKWIINFSWIYDPTRERPNDLARPHFNRKCWSGFSPESSGIMGIMIREGGGVGGEDKLTVL